MDYFHQADDPYSALAAKALPLLAERYDIEIRAHAVSPPDAAAAPEGEMLRLYAARDAKVLAKGLGWPPARIGADFPLPPDTPESRAEGDARRRKLGHYLGATFYYEGEWYWGLDRLDYLEERLAPFRRPGAPTARIAPRREVALKPLALSANRPVLDAFISFRSPYTYLAIPRLIDLARHYGADLRLRFVLPMVMRGLPVPIEKRLYIVRDCKREAERLGLSFGKISDPVGAATERGLAVLHHAIPAGKGPQFALSFLKGAFAEGIDGATDEGLAAMTGRAGLDEGFVAHALKDEGWRQVAEENRRAMFAAGVWGVPAFSVNSGALHWGQDRLWAIEDELRAAHGTA